MRMGFGDPVACGHPMGYAHLNDCAALMYCGGLMGCGHPMCCDDPMGCGDAARCVDPVGCLGAMGSEGSNWIRRLLGLRRPQSAPGDPSTIVLRPHVHRGGEPGGRGGYPNLELRREPPALRLRLGRALDAHGFGRGLSAIDAQRYGPTGWEAGGLA